jgi:tetratricopeptide (TPR) repeat protein
MPLDPNFPGASRQPKPRDQDEHYNPSHPPSKPLQIFLLVALIISGAAYAVQQWTELTTDETMARRPSRLRHLVENQAKFITNTDLGRKAEASKKYQEAILYYRQALMGEDIAEGHLNLGNVLLKAGNLDMAFSQFKEAIREKADFEPAYIAWGQALTHEGKIDEAVQIYQDALRSNTNLAQVHYNFALALQEKQQNAEVAAHAAEAENQSQMAANATAEAKIYGADAAKHYAAAARGGLNSADFWYRYGLLLNQQGNYADAESFLNKAVRQQPGLGAAQFQLALADDRQGKYGEAIAHYEATLAAIPDDVATLNNLALLYATATNAEARSPQMAVALATRACDATIEQNARYMDTLARAYSAEGDFFQAISWEDKAVRRATQLGDHDLLRELQPRFRLYVEHRTK